MLARIEKMLTVGALFAIAVFAAIAVPGRVSATTLARMSLAQMAHAADVVVRARCSSVASLWDRGSIWTISDFQILETFKGAPPAQIAVRSPGGRVGNLTMNVEAAPKFRSGEEGVLFLEKTVAGDYSVTAWAQGSFRIHKGAPGRQETVTQDSSALQVFDPATRQFRSEGVRNLPLSQFRERLVAALAQSSIGGRP